jgi:PAS domain S-box-containing protein
MVYRCLNDENWTMLYVSNGCRDLTGLSTTDLLSSRTTYDQLVHPDDRRRMRDAIADAIRRRARFDIEYRLVLADGVERWVWEQGVPTFDIDNELDAIEGFITDITLRKQGERLETERKMFVKQYERTDEAINIVGHELRTPLAALRAMSEVLIEDPDARASKHGDFLDGIHSEVIRMSEMVTNMLEAARMSEGGSQWAWQDVALERICREAMDIIRPLRQNDGVALELDVEPANLTMRGDADAIRRLVLNLLGNACRYTKQGRVRLVARRNDAAAARYVRLTVEDTGSGLDPQQQRKLGVPFAHKRGPMHPAIAHGTGLGLAICNQIAAVHGGKISVTSKQDVGTTFTVELRSNLPAPVVDVAAEPIHCDAA